jgi:hypothetical protein
VDCGYLEDRPIALEGRKWLRDVLEKHGHHTR